MTSFSKKQIKINDDVKDPGLVQLADKQTNAVQSISPSGAIEVGELIRLAGGNFETGVLLPNLWAQSVIGSGLANVITGELNLSTGVTANSESSIQSQKRARFVTATFNKAHLAVQNPNFMNPNVIRQWGMFDPVQPIVPGLTTGDGVFFQNNSGIIQIVRRKAGIDIEVVDEIDFNGNDVPGFPDLKFIKDELVHTYEIVFNAGSALFFQDRRLVHKIDSLDSVAYETVHLPLGMKIQNINGNTTNNIIRTRGFSCSRIGTVSAQPDFSLISAPGSLTIKNSPGTLRDIIIISTGTGGSNIEIYDDPGPAPFSNLIGEIELTSQLVDLKPNLDFNFGLSYIASGAQFQVLLVFD